MRDWAAELVERARAEGVELTGDDGLLTALVRQVLQTGLEVEMTDHVGYEAHAVEGRGSGNGRNGSYPKCQRDRGPDPPRHRVPAVRRLAGGGGAADAVASVVDRPEGPGAPRVAGGYVVTVATGLALWGADGITPRFLGSLFQYFHELDEFRTSVWLIALQVAVLLVPPLLVAAHLYRVAGRQDGDR